MTTYVSRGYTPADLSALISLARRAVAERDLHPVYEHPGDIAWRLYDTPETEDIRLWFDGEELAGWVALEPPVRMDLNARGGLAAGPALAAEMLAWAERRCQEAYANASPEPLPRAYAMLGTQTLSSDARDSDVGRIAIFEQHGYVRQERGGYRYAQALDRTIPPPGLPPGYRLRYPTDDDIEERADLHRDAWSVWGASTFSAEKYRRLRAAPEYDAELDVVLEAPDGRLVSYCICWADVGSGVGTFEPVGTRPGFARQGLGKATIREGLRRLKAKGMQTATIGTASVNEGAAALYPSVGFELVEMEHMYTKSLTP
ncbi:MAG: GNAT family N-acetyltransferase [Dehalococcoidia bacterium]